MNKTFEYFKEKGFIFREHAINRALGQKQGKGKRAFTSENVLDVLKTGKKYHQAEGNKTVYFKDGIAVIQANDTGEIVSIVTRSPVKNGALRANQRRWIRIASPFVKVSLIEK